jgi:hypothetical protein
VANIYLIKYPYLSDRCESKNGDWIQTTYSTNSTIIMSSNIYSTVKYYRENTQSRVKTKLARWMNNLEDGGSFFLSFFWAVLFDYINSKRNRNRFSSSPFSNSNFPIFNYKFSELLWINFRIINESNSTELAIILVWFEINSN